MPGGTRAETITDLPFLKRMPEFVSRQKRTVQLDYVVQQLEWLEKSANTDTDLAYLKAAASSVLKSFAHSSTSPFFNDERILHISLIIGRLSRNLGLKGVMKQIYDRGQFAKLAEFYIKWAEIYAEEKDRLEFDKICSLAVERRAEPHEKMIKALKGLRERHFGLMDIVEEETCQLFGLEEGKQQIPAPQNQPATRESNKENVQATSPLVLGGTSFTQNFYSKAMQDFSNTLPVAPPRLAQSQSESKTVDADATLVEQANAVNFKVYVDEEKMDLEDDDELVAGMHFQQKKAGIAASTPANPLAPTIAEHMMDFSLQQEPTNEMHVVFPPKNSVAPEQMTAFERRQTLNLATKKPAVPKGSSQKFGPEGIPGGNALLGGSLISAVGGLTIGGDGDDSEEPTGCGLRSLIQSETNPWDDKVRQRIMGEQRLYPTYLHDCSIRMKRLEPGMLTVFEGERFDVLDLIGHGGFAKVYRCITEEGNTYAVKVESPPCRWEVYVCELLRLRMPKSMLPGIMNVQDAYIYPNMSAIVYEYHQYGNLLDLVNSMPGKGCSGLLTVYLSWEMARILRDVHQAKLIHGDVKPDNFMLVRKLNENWTAEEALHEPSFTMKLIDWGRAIDMVRLEGKTFRGRAGTECFDCFEMLDGRPWTYQTDFYGFVGTVHVLLFGEYMKTALDGLTNKYSIVQVIKRRCNQRNLIQDIFQMCMNISSCDELPDWTTIVNGLAESVRYSMSQDRMEWKTAVREFNQALASNVKK